MFKHEVPLLFREPYVDSGYRHPHQPWRYYITSIFQRHNECINTWTHLIAFIFVARRLLDFSRSYDLIGDPYMWPLLSCTISSLLTFLCSTGAHCFQSRSELVHYTCFMLDYAGIGMYGLGSTQLHYFFCIEPSVFSLMKSIYLPVGIVLAIMTCVCCSMSKTMYRRPYPFKRRLWQLGPVITLYVWLNLPIVHRICRSFLTNQWDDALSDHVQEMLWFMLAGFFFGSDIPQRFYPGKFDMFGHSHQFFHFCLMMTALNQLDAIVLDYSQYRDQIYARPTPSFLSTVGALIIVCFINVVVVMAFRDNVKRSMMQERRKTNSAATQNSFHDNHIKCH